MTRPLTLRVDEASFQATVIDFARLHDWRVAHFRVAMTSKGWRTPVAADGKGFPDLVMVRERLVVAELKGTSGQVRPEQRQWLDALQRAGVEAYVWKPDDWPEIERTLGGHE